MSYIDRARKAVGNVSVSAGTSGMQQNATNYNKKINAMGQYGGTIGYAKQLDSIMGDLNSPRYDFGTDRAMTQFAQDYSALAKLNVADAQANIDAQNAGYGNDYSGAVADQYKPDYVTDMGLLNTEIGARATDDQNILNAAQNAQELGAFDYQKWQDRMGALQQARSLTQDAYEKLYKTDLNRYMDNQDRLYDLSKYYEGVTQAQKDRALKQRQADQNYAINALQNKYSLMDKKKSSKSKSNSGTAGILATSSGDSTTGNESSEDKKKTVKIDALPQTVNRFQMGYNGPNRVTGIGNSNQLLDLKYLDPKKAKKK